MRIHSVFDPEFHAYGQIADGMEDAVKPLLEALAKPPCPREPAMYRRPPGGRKPGHRGFPVRSVFYKIKDTAVQMEFPIIMYVPPRPAGRGT